MKNVRPYNLKTCIILTTDEYSNLIHQLLNHEYDVEYSYDGISYMPYDDGNEKEVDTDALYAQLAEHFGVNKVTSIHTDDCDICGVWICYTNETQTAGNDEDIKNACSNYNGLADKKDIISQLKYDGDTLKLGSKEQFAHNTHQYILTKDKTEAMCIIKSLTTTLCFTHGE